jgi:hypothetical protein
MLDLCKLIFGTVIDLLRSRATLEAEILVLRQQISVLQRTRSKRPHFISIDRLILGSVCGLFPMNAPDILSAVFGSGFFGNDRLRELIARNADGHAHGDRSS